MSFTSLGLSPALIEALEVQKNVNPTEIQQAVIPDILKGSDVLGIAKTGSGKTAGYVLPILMNLQGSKSAKNRYVKVLVLVPSRELALQVNEVFNLFGSALKESAKIMAVHGGVSINPQMIALQGVDVLIATPGRLLELATSNAVHLSEIDTLVLDEADKMLNLGFEEEMSRIFALLPKKRQNLLFSATLSSEVQNINNVLLNNPLVVKIEEKTEKLELIAQSAYKVTEERKGPLLRYIIKHNHIKQVLVFTSSVFKADSVVNKLNRNGIEALATHSKKSHRARTEALAKFKSGKLRVLVATDLMARGIDIEFLPYVINYELPRSPKDYIHRIGRTGRASATGEAISFVTPEDEHHFKVIQKKMGKPVTMIDSEDIDLQGF